MEIQTYHGAKEFLSAAGEYLARDEARYGLILGLAKVLENDPHHYGKDNPWFCSIGAETDYLAVAMRTPPRSVILAFFSGDKQTIAENIMTAVAESFKDIPSVLGEKELTDLFADLWCREHRTTIIHIQAQRIYRLDKVNNLPLSQGKMRPATLADKDLVIKWAHAFNVDVYGVDRNLPESDPTPGIEKGRVFFWEYENRPVSMASKIRPTEKGMSVGYVYTPTEFRNKGYATSCVAELSRNILQSGKEFCTLYTDLANPTSNSIYMKIGYRPVCDSVEYTFKK